jgi:hypothetical protein
MRRHLEQRPKSLTDRSLNCAIPQRPFQSPLTEFGLFKPPLGHDDESCAEL